MGKLGPPKWGCCKCMASRCVGVGSPSRSPPSPPWRTLRPIRDSCNSTPFSITISALTYDLWIVVSWQGKKEWWIPNKETEMHMKLRAERSWANRRKRGSFNISRWTNESTHTENGKSSREQKTYLPWRTLLAFISDVVRINEQARWYSIWLHSTVGPLVLDKAIHALAQV